MKYQRGKQILQLNNTIIQLWGLSENGVLDLFTGKFYKHKRMLYSVLTPDYSI